MYYYRQTRYSCSDRMCGATDCENCYGPGAGDVEEEVSACGHEECPVLTDGCDEVFTWEIDILRGKWDWSRHPDHPEVFKGTPDEARKLFASVRGKARMWPVQEPVQRESEEDLLFFN